MKIMFAAMGSEIISIEALSAVLKENGHQCALAFDRGLFDDKQYFSIPFLSRIFDDSKQVVKDIVSYKPGLLAFSVFADNFQWCLDIAYRVKEAIDVTIIFGGIHPTCAPQTCITQKNVDIICLGEGEYPLLELAKSLGEGNIDYTIKNLWFKNGKEIIKNPLRPLIKNLDTLPVIDKQLFDKFIPIRPYYLTVTNKGCVSRCSYCSQNFYSFWEGKNNLGPFYRERSVGNVIKELKIMKQRYNFKRVDIKNNVLSASKAWALEFAKEYKKHISVPFRIMGHPKTIDCQIALVLKDAGCWHVQIGIESLNPHIRKFWLNRNESNDEIEQALCAMDTAGLDYSADLMVGLPEETEDDIKKALIFLSGRKHLVRASIFWLKYLPSVEITEHALKCDHISEDDLYKINNGLTPNYLSTGSVVNSQKKERLFGFQILFRLLPIMPKGLVIAILNKKYYRLCKYLPQVPIIITIDIIVSVFKKDHWAIFAIYSYFWEIKRRILRFFNVN